MKIRDPHFYGSGRVEPSPTWYMAPHLHSFHEIIAVVEGRLHLKSRDHTLTAGPGDILFYRSGFVHEETSDRETPVRSVFIAFDTADSLSWLPLHTHDTRGRVQQFVTWLVDDERNRSAPEMRRPLFDAMVGELRRLCAVTHDPWLEDILAFIRKKLTAPLTLDDLAHRGKMSKFAFVRKFKRLTGRTPMAELRLRRLDLARTLILTTNLPLKAVAPAVGIGDEYQLSKLFRTHFNLSPRDLRTRISPNVSEGNL